MELTQQKKDMLKNIVSNPQSFGAFSGMIFNKFTEMKPEEITQLGGYDATMKIMIESALDIKLKIIEMSR